MPTVRVSQLEDALSDVDFPIAKEDLIAHIAAKDVPEEVRKAIRSVPPVDYGNADEVIRSVTVDVE